MNICISHKNCNDGVASAAVVQKYMKENNLEIEHIAMGYEDDPQNLLNKVHADTELVFVDFSVSREWMVKLGKVTKHVLVIDHHKGAEEQLVDLPSNVDVIFDMEKSGAGLTWDYYFPKKKRPLIIDIVEDRDLWKFKIDATPAVTAIIRDKGMMLEQWITMLDYTKKDINKMEAEGKAVLRHNIVHTDLEIQKQLQWPNIIKGKDIPEFHAFNSTTLVSEQLSYLLNHKLYELDVAVSFRVAKGKLFCSARSIDDKSAKLVAEFFGGGGHPNAAGFTLSIEQAVKMGFL